MVRQEKAGRRRWFEDAELELVVWHDEAGAVAGFQLIYWQKDGERALTWRPGAGFSHSRVDSGSNSPLKNESPILHPDGVVPWHQMESLFQDKSAALEAPLREMVLARLKARK